MIVGVLGGGQLGRMLALAGYPLGLTFRFLDPSPTAPAGQVAHRVAGDYEDHAALDRFAAGLSVVTYEFENVPAASVRRLAERLPVFPPPGALETAQDRLSEKTLFRRLELPVAPFFPVDSFADLQTALSQTGFPAVLKTRRFGYDGKGQWVLRSNDEAGAAWAAVQKHFTPLILEGFVSFERELSVIGVRSIDGQTAFYPLVENHHEGGILRVSYAPAPCLSAALQHQAEDALRRIMEALDYVGVLALELFQQGDQLIANEIAPRVHNSGHWTIEGADTSQFENHLRAILGLPLGSTEVWMPSAMWNLLGDLPNTEEILAVPGAHLHLYGKSARPGRKVGHITVCCSADVLLERLAKIRTLAPQS